MNADAPTRPRPPSPRLPEWVRLGTEAGGDGHAAGVPTLETGPPRTRRVANLDLLRALAIVPVVLVNAVGEGLIDAGPWGDHVLQSGWVGVDLFFVLSGWLVGGLYWRELTDFGSVQTGRFWARRWLRTIPPYLVALVVIYGVRAVATTNAEPFDWRYLAFAQNYTGLPYWGVSWSLCVEEHFYLALPLVLGVSRRFRGGVPLALGAAALGSLLARVLTVADGADPWGLQYTATHMRLEGLALGVAAAYVYHRRADLWPALRRAGTLLALPGLAFVATIPWLPVDILNRYAYAGVDLAFVAVLVAVADRKALPFASSAAVRWTALVSYSVYMTHATVFDAVTRTPLGGLPLPLALASGLAAVAVVGAGFYWVIERPALRLRRRIAPRRSHAPSPALG
ncbi:acyltransferase family protein [Rubrivirga sp. IMCC45206]|uniref:acyltransferase family protein n=1 Tax=Rubrivirga sp. IMCC45206 TaxID=3391614 RepID=UPI00398FC786